VVTALTALAFLWTKSAHVAYFIAGALSTNIIGKFYRFNPVPRMKLTAYHLGFSQSHQTVHPPTTSDPNKVASEGFQPVRYS
jgi:hypothetical protein